MEKAELYDTNQDDTEAKKEEKVMLTAVSRIIEFPDGNDDSSQQSKDM